MSRAAWISFLGTAALAFVIAMGYGLLTLRRAFQLSMALFAIVIILVVSFFSTIRGRFEVDFADSWQLRKQLAETALDIARDHAAIGVGLNNYTIVYPQYNPSYAAELMENDNMITVVHNVYLLIAAETGIIGLTTFMLFYGSLFAFGLRGLRDCSIRSRATIIGLLAGILGAMLCDLTGFSLWSEICMYTIAFMAGVIDRLNPGRAARRLIRWETSVIAAAAHAPQTT
jgi:O-antigen ligase